MSFRKVVITKHCKLSYKNDYLIVRTEEINMIHLSEISHIILDTTAVSITAYLINELVKRKIGLVFCDEMHNPSSEVQALHGSHNSTKKIRKQVKWDDNNKAYYWQEIVKNKIRKQSEVLRLYRYLESAERLDQYVLETEPRDISNREGHAAKVYFNALFGMGFRRGNLDDVNSSLDYGYAILLSTINKEVHSNGYITELGIQHKNEYNAFNLSCDLMEPFRPIIDKIILENPSEIFDIDMKAKLINFTNSIVKYRGSNQTVSYVISSFIKLILNGSSKGERVRVEMFDFIES